MPRVSAPPPRRGTSLVELLVVVTLLGVVGGALGRALLVLASRERLARVAAEREAQRRAAFGVLALALRGLSPADGDLVAFDDAGVLLHATIGATIVCAAAGDRLVVPAPRGEAARRGLTAWGVAPHAGDRARIFLPGVDGEADVWAPGLALADGPTAGPPGACARVGVGEPDGATLVLLLAAPLADSPVVLPGTPLRLARELELRAYASGDGTQLGVRDCFTAACGPQPVAGPFARSRGVRLEWLDAAGGATTDGARVARVVVTLRDGARGADSARSVVGVRDAW